MGTIQDNQVRVYYNIRKRCYSVQNRVPGKGWRLKGHTQDIFLKDVTFKVYEAGRKRAIKEQSKNVHAYVIGTPISLNESIALTAKIGEERYVKYSYARYNPFKYDSFVDTRTEQPINKAELVRLCDRNIHCIFAS